MSGFFGMIRHDGKPVEERLLQRIANELAFRGPDGTSVWREANVGGCFTWMRTGPAPQAAQQPVTLGNRFFLWGDLRLDARQQLQQQLSLDSFPEAPALTSEHLLLHAWAKWGPVAPRLALLRERCTALLAKARYVSPENGWWRFKRNCVPRPLVALANARRLGRGRKSGVRGFGMPSAVHFVYSESTARISYQKI